MSVIERIKRKVNSFEISTKITIAYALCFITLLLVINAAMWFGIMTALALYTPAEESIQYSMVRIQRVLEALEENYADYEPMIFHGALVSGVVLRVVDEDGTLFIDTDDDYPTIEMFYANLLVNPPLFADKEFEIARIGSSLIYCRTMDYTHDDKTVTLYFFRTITSELIFFDDFEKFLLMLDGFGVLLAISAGWLISRRILTPIKTMSALAREIAFEKMGGRIPIGTANDELSELAKTLTPCLTGSKVASTGKENLFPTPRTNSERPPPSSRATSNLSNATARRTKISCAKT